MKAHKVFALLLLFIQINICNSQSLNSQWVKSATGSGVVQLSNGNAITSDVKGNIYVTGYFANSTINFGSITLTNTSVDGSPDIFIVKYDSTGRVIWAKSAGGTKGDVAMSISTDAECNIYIAGYFYSEQLAFDSIAIINTNDSTDDIFIAKYDLAGHAIWAREAGGGSFDYATGVSTDKNGNVYVTGAFSSPNVRFDNEMLYNSDSIKGKEDVFIAKYDSAGMLLWSRKAGGQSSDVSNSICTDSACNVFIAGFFFSDTIHFDSMTVTKMYGAKIFYSKV
jgi:hypothetical protein